MTRRDVNEGDVFRKGFATSALEKGATEGQVPSIGSDGEVAFVAAGGGSQPAASGWTGPFVCRVADFQTLTVAGASSGDFTLSDLGFLDSYAAFSVFDAGRCIVPTVPNGHAYQALIGGITGSVEPTWPTGGGTVVDLAVTWKDLGPVPVVTAPIAFNASAVQVQAALDLVSPGKFTCSGGPLNTSPVEIEAAADVPLIVLGVADSTNGTTTCVPTTAAVNNDTNSRRYALATLDEGTIFEDALIQRVIPFDAGTRLAITSPVAPDGHDPEPTASDNGDDWYTIPLLDLGDSEVFTYMTGLGLAAAMKAPSPFGAMLAADVGTPLRLPVAVKRTHTIYALFVNSLASATVGEVRIWIKTATPVAPS